MHGMGALVLVNGRVSTARPGEPPFSGGVAIVGDRIVAVGGDSAVRPTPGDQQQLLPDGGVASPSPSPMP